ncbi:glycosyltransferase family 4 protein [Phormidium sp. CLA17]|uniref:glycosyltransferase family 4 protein n=1 Tax=Leptolyngbya sp. Cla-17 TaxID=2803751 RepID=UPI0014930BD6|nr:glycosyltransferase family 4 protein [Leptolyngbya sp. Cla-17]MBM0740361.1 glycosyltransferase family 4 protein [Leptolyngbya sp. Cla-17]
MDSISPLKLLFLSTSVGPLGSGMGGGVELTLKNIAQALRDRNHSITIVAPAGSVLQGFPVIEIPGRLQSTAQSEGREAWVALPPESVLANMWAYARLVQTDYDLILNFAYDWLPFYLTPFFQTPIAHLVSMGSLTDAIDQMIGQVVTDFPSAIALHSRAQAETFEFGDRCRVVGNGFDLSQYQFCAEPDNTLAWVGRLAPEKGLEDAVAAAQATGIPLKIWGVLQDVPYWHDICDQYPDAPVTYEGFLLTAELQQELGKCRALLMTPRWVEAFGNVVIEALACGVPVIAYDRDGPAEIVRDGKTGWLVPPDRVKGLVDAIAKIDQIDRRDCREQAEQDYSLKAMGDRMEQWFAAILT